MGVACLIALICWLDPHTSAALVAAVAKFEPIALANRVGISLASAVEPRGGYEQRAAAGRMTQRHSQIFNRSDAYKVENKVGNPPSEHVLLMKATSPGSNNVPLYHYG